MCGYMAPALVTSPADLITYHIDTSDPVEQLTHPGYSERFIRKPRPHADTDPDPKQTPWIDITQHKSSVLPRATPTIL
jgi:hypothetical protein